MFALRYFAYFKWLATGFEPLWPLIYMYTSGTWLTRYERWLQTETKYRCDNPTPTCRAVALNLLHLAFLNLNFH